MRLSRNTLVLRKFDVDEEARGGALVEIIGRRPGFLAWVLTEIGLDAGSTLKVTERDVRFSRSTLFGLTHQVVPVQNVASTHCTYSKPISPLWMAGAFAASGLVVAAGGGQDAVTISAIAFVLAFGFLFAYVRSEKMKISIGIESTGGTFTGISFKRGVIEGVEVNEELALKAIDLVNGAVARAHPVSY